MIKYDLSKVLSYGIKKKDSYSENLKIRTLNGVTLFSLFVSLFFCFLSIYLKLYDISIIDFIVSLILFSSLYFSSIEKVAYSKIIIFYVLPPYFLIYSFFYGNIGTNSYYFVYLIVGFYVLNEKKEIYFYFLYIILLFAIASYLGRITFLTEKYKLFGSIHFYSSITVSMIVSSIILIVFRFNKNKELEIIEIQSSKAEINFKQELLNQEKKFKNKVTSNIHDTLGGYIQTLEYNIHKEANKKEIQTVIDQFKKQYRLLLNSMFIPKINSKSLFSAILDFCNTINEVSTCNISFIFPEKSNMILSEEVSSELYMIISEGLLNSVKHSNSNEISLSIEYINQNLFIRILDYGVGFDIKKKFNRTLGLTSIKSRTKNLKGDIEIISKKNIGTDIKIKIPIQ